MRGRFDAWQFPLKDKTVVCMVEIEQPVKGHP
jgi:hypothetical protein